MGLFGVNQQGLILPWFCMHGLEKKKIRTGKMRRLVNKGEILRFIDKLSFI